MEISSSLHPPGIHTSPLGVILKKNKPDKWRLIVDLSSPAGFNINDGISQEYSSLRYTCLDHLASLVNSVDRGALLVKADIKEAYRMIPIHPHDQHLLGVQWNDHYYIDRMLPFGLRSAPKIFLAVADGLQWILTQYGIQVDTKALLLHLPKEKLEQLKQELSQCILRKKSPKGNYKVRLVTFNSLQK